MLLLFAVTRNPFEAADVLRAWTGGSAEIGRQTLIVWGRGSHQPQVDEACNKLGVPVHRTYEPAGPYTDQAWNEVRWHCSSAKDENFTRVVFAVSGEQLSSILLGSSSARSLRPLGDHYQATFVAADRSAATGPLNCANRTALLRSASASRQVDSLRGFRQYVPGTGWCPVEDPRNPGAA